MSRSYTEADWLSNRPVTVAWAVEFIPGASKDKIYRATKAKNVPRCKGYGQTKYFPRDLVAAIEGPEFADRLFGKT